jgi:hypothetical protein
MCNRLLRVYLVALLFVREKPPRVEREYDGLRTRVTTELPSRAQVCLGNDFQLKRRSAVNHRLVVMRRLFSEGRCC